MSQYIPLCLITCLIYLSNTVFAEMPHQDGIFLTLGVSYNSVKFKQHYSATGTGDVFDETSTLVATGSAGGPAAPFSETYNTLAPVIEVGYLNHFRCSNLFWGFKCAYQYLDITSINTLTDTPQAGFLDPVGGSPLSFTGNVITKSAQMRIDHRIDLLAFTGLTLEHLNIYLGAGPALFYTQSNIYQVFGLANLSGLPRDATGSPVNFSNSKWVWGGAIQLGISYLINHCWRFDFNYTYAISTRFSNSYSSPFSTSLVGGYTDIGTLYVKDKTQIFAQGLHLTICRRF